MTISFDKLFGIQPQVLELRGKRNELLAGNLANADTPGYKAKDLDFKSALKLAQLGIDSVQLDKTRSNHIGAIDLVGQSHVKYRNPTQPSIDGNTVENQIEQAKYAENALRYQASLRFMSGKITGIMTALKGD